MKKVKVKVVKKKSRKAWKDPDFEIHSLLDEKLYIVGTACQCYSPSVCPSDPAGS